jgi:hypothetical protein
MHLAYTVYFGGVRIVQLGIDAAMATSTYDVTAQMETIGMAKWAVPWTSVARTKGEITGLRLQPTQHRQSGELRGKRRTVAIDFKDGRVTSLQVVPTAREDYGGRQEVRPDQMTGSIDPASALLAAARAIELGRGCVDRLPVFDGRRRYDVVAKEAGTEILPRNDYNLYSGPAHRCDFVFEPIAGYETRRGDEDMDKRRVRKGAAWFAAISPSQPIVPVLVQFESEVATTLIHLNSVEQPAAASAGDNYQAHEAE